MPGDGIFQWWAGSFGAEHFDHGPFATREEALAEACDHMQPDELIAVVEADTALIRTEGVLDADDIIGRLIEDNQDDGGACAADGSELVISDEDEAALQRTLDAALAAWVRTRAIAVEGPRTFYRIRRQELFMVAADRTAIPCTQE